MLHAAVLKPDLHLALREIQAGRNLDPPGTAQVLVEVKLLLQLQELGVCVGGPQPSWQSVLWKWKRGIW